MSLEPKKKPAYERALEILASAKEPRPRLQDLLSVLTHPETAPLPPDSSPAIWLAAWYQRYQKEKPELCEALAGGVIGLLDSPDTDAGTLDRILIFVEEAKLQEASRPIRALVESRQLTKLSGEYSDLHGRALCVLFVLNAIEPMKCLEDELKHGDYVALAFAFVRERAKDQIARTLPRIAAYPFFAEALRTVLLTYPEKEGPEILGFAARHSRNHGFSATQAFLKAIPRLPLQSRDRDDLISILTNEPVKAQPTQRSPAVGYAGMRGRSQGYPQALRSLEETWVH